MDEGAVVAWLERFNHDELSAIQHAMNLKLQDEAAFFAEYQNQPLPEETVTDGMLAVSVLVTCRIKSESDYMRTKVNRMAKRRPRLHFTRRITNAVKTHNDGSS